MPQNFQPLLPPFSEVQSLLASIRLPCLLSSFLPYVLESFSREKARLIVRFTLLVFLLQSCSAFFFHFWKCPIYFVQFSNFSFLFQCLVSVSPSWKNSRTYILKYKETKVMLCRSCAKLFEISSHFILKNTLRKSFIPISSNDGERKRRERYTFHQLWSREMYMPNSLYHCWGMLFIDWLTKNSGNNSLKERQPVPK